MIHNQTSRSYIIVAGNIGMGLCIFSQVGRVCMSFTSDDTLCDREMNRRIMYLTTKTIIDEIEKMQREKHSEQSDSGATTSANSPQSKKIVPELNGNEKVEKENCSFAQNEIEKKEN